MTVNKNNTPVWQIDTKSSPREIATALLQIRPWPKSIPPSLKPLLTLQVIVEFIYLVPKPWDTSTDEDNFRQAIKFCFNMAKSLQNKEDFLVSRALLFILVFDWNWIRLHRGKRGAARRARRILLRIQPSIELTYRFPFLDLHFLLRLARLWSLTDIKEAVFIYRGALDSFEKLTRKMVQGELQRGEIILGAQLQQGLANALYEAGSFSEAVEHADTAAKAFEHSEEVELTHQALTIKGMCLAATGKNFEALAILKRVRDYALFREEVPRMVTISRVMWRLLVKCEQQKASDKLLERTVSIFNTSKHTQFETVKLIADFLDNAGYYNKATDLVERYFYYYLRHENHLSALNSAFARINLAIDKGDLEQALKWFKKARQVYIRSMPPACRADLYSYVGHIAYATNLRYEQAARLFAKAGRIYCKHGSLSQIQDAYIQYATACTELGEMEKSLKALDAALQVPLPYENLKRARILGQAGSIYARLARFGEASDFLEREIMIYEAISAWDLAAFPLRQLGGLYQRMDRLKEAEKCYAESLRIFILRKNHLEIAMTGNNLASLALIRGEPKQAMRWLKAALKEFKKAGSTNFPLTILNNIGWALVGVGHPKLALSVFQKALSSVKKERVYPIRYARILAGIASAYLLLQSRTEAINYLKQAIELIESYRGSFELGRNRSGVTELCFALYTETICLCRALDQPELAFLLMQLANGRTIFESIAQMSSDSEGYLQNPPKNMTFDFSYEKEYSDRFRDPQRLLKHAQHGPLSHDQALKYIGNCCLLQYFFRGDSLFCCSTSKHSGTQIHQLAIGTGTDFIRRVQNLIQNFVSQPKGTQLLVNINKSLRDFYDILLRPLEKAFQNTERIIIVPSSSLYNIPFGCLYNGRQYFAERHILSYLPHVGLLTFSRTDSVNLNSWVGFGDPRGDLSYARSEIERVATLFQNVTLNTGDKATEQTLLSSAQNADVLHIATRVIRYSENPYDAHFEVHDGDKTVTMPCGNIMGAKLQAKLVVLRCCYTGEAKPWYGGDIAAIWTCFLLAGCGAVFASPWQVYESDDVSRLVIRFYELWMRNKKSPAEALALAQREAIEQNTYPAMWGFPLLIGNV